MLWDSQAAPTVGIEWQPLSTNETGGAVKKFRLAQYEAREQLIETSCVNMTQDDMIGCAVRRDRLRLRESQRTYAVRRGLSVGFVARLESRPGDLRLGAVMAGLAPTAYALAVVPDGIRASIAADMVDPGGAAIASVVRDVVASSGVSLRRFAESMGVPRMTLSRAQNEPSELKLTTVRTVLKAGMLSLVVVMREGGMVLEPGDWDVGEQAARARGGTRRLAGHRLPLQTPDGPRWWWRTYESRLPGVEVPQWTTVGPDRIPDVPELREAPRWIDSA